MFVVTHVCIVEYQPQTTKEWVLKYKRCDKKQVALHAISLEDLNEANQPKEEHKIKNVATILIVIVLIIPMFKKIARRWLGVL